MSRSSLWNSPAAQDGSVFCHLLKGAPLEEIPVTILQRFDEIYRKLSDEENLIALPAREKIMRSVNLCSFRMFDEAEDYFESERAKANLQYVSPHFGERAFRAFFNKFSKKVYVDLNRDVIRTIRITAETEQQVLCDILRSILSVDPNL